MRGRMDRTECQSGISPDLGRCHDRVDVLERLD